MVTDPHVVVTQLVTRDCGIAQPCPSHLGIRLGELPGRAVRKHDTPRQTRLISHLPIVEGRRTGPELAPSSLTVAGSGQMAGTSRVTGSGWCPGWRRGVLGCIRVPDRRTAPRSARPRQSGRDA